MDNDEVLVIERFEDPQLRDLRFLHEAARLGPVHVCLETDKQFEALQGRPAKFPAAERKYFLESLRQVSRVTISDRVDHVIEPYLDGSACGVMAVPGWGDDAELFAKDLRPRDSLIKAIEESDVQGLPVDELTESLEMWKIPTGRKKVVVTGCYDFLHSGHVRFFEEVSELGDLYVVVGHDENIRQLKGPKNPMFPAEQRQYMVGCVRFVRQALISSGNGWMDAALEFARIKPDIYAVNEDGDKPEKKAWCAANGVEYRVLKRLPKEGLTRRSSTGLRGY